MQSCTNGPGPPFRVADAFGSLSTELVRAVLSFADVRTVGRSGCVSKQLRHSCSTILRSPAYIRGLQPVLATHVITLRDGEAILPGAVDESANPGRYNLQRTCVRAAQTSAALLVNPDVRERCRLQTIRSAH